MSIYVLFKSNEILEKLTLYTSNKPTKKDRIKRGNIYARNVNRNIKNKNDTKQTRMNERNL